MRDLNYILKRVIIGVLIALCLLFIKAKVTFAKTANNVYWYGNTINGQSVTLGTNLWFNADTSYTWTIDRLGCAFDYNENACTGLDCTIYVDLYFSTNMAFSDWSGKTNGYTWSQFNLGNRIVYDNFSSGYFVKRFIFVPNREEDTGTNGLINYYRTGNITGTGNSVPYGGVFKLQSYKCGLVGDMEQLPNENPQYQQNQTIINNQTAQNQILNNVVNAVNNSSELMQTLIGRVNHLGDTMRDDSIEENNSQFSEFQSYMATNGVITNLISMPVTLFTKVLSTIDGTCSTYNLGSLYGTDLTLPCINISNYLGSTLWGVIDIITSGVLIYAISRHFVKVFNKMSSLEESDVIDD